MAVREQRRTPPDRSRYGSVGVTSHTVPQELIVAAGHFPLLLCFTETSDSPDAPHATYMEDAFDAHTRSVFDYLVSGQGSSLKAVVVPRTSEREHKLFLYLKEVQRQKKDARIPPVYLFNLLHTRTPESRDYSRDRVMELKRWVESIAGVPIDDDTLRDSIRASNAARAAARRLQALREGPDARLPGSDATALLRARYGCGADEFVRLANRRAEEFGQRPPLKGPRILIKGSPLMHSTLHQAIESHGAVVFAEDDAWGARSATPDISTDMDPMNAIADHYYLHETSPRVLPLAEADQWFYDKAGAADGVVFYLPPEDDTLGWDYPRHCRHLDERNIRHTLVRADAARLDDETRHRLGVFLKTLPQRQARHG
jgi:benzoyl-CoA reductase/2-hydroxyglutaryl-CoA dehydratase subunit BcrC/BadD/HgdB